VGVKPLWRLALVYTAARAGLLVLFGLLIFSVSGLLGYQMNAFLLLLLALLGSSLAALFLLATPRDELARAMAERRP
jgi:hypothetical protein